MGQGTGAGMSTHVPQKPRSPNMEAQSTGDKPGDSQDVADKSRSPSSVSPAPPGCSHRDYPSRSGGQGAHTAGQVHSLAQQPCLYVAPNSTGLWVTCTVSFPLRPCSLPGPCA